MPNADPTHKGRARRRLSAPEKYEIYVQLLTGKVTQREAAERWGVDRSTIANIHRVAKEGALRALAASVPGRPEQHRSDALVSTAQAEIERLRALVVEQSEVIHLAAGKDRWD